MAHDVRSVWKLIAINDWYIFISLKAFRLERSEST